jgi:hypothetical protein
MEGVVYIPTGMNVNFFGSQVDNRPREQRPAKRRSVQCHARLDRDAGPPVSIPVD